jgi:trigger factor
MPIEASRLRIDLQERERWRRTLKVTVPAELVDEERQKAASKLAKRLKLPGFRAGKIPATVVQRRFGQALDQEMLNELIGEAYREALRVEELRPISEGQVENVDYEPAKDLSFEISFDVNPEIELSRLGGFKVRRPSVTVSDDDVERVIARLREQAGAWKPAESGTPVAGDRVAVTVTRLDTGEEIKGRAYELVLGEGEAIPDVEAAIMTLEPGAADEFTVTFPESEAGNTESQRLRIELRERSVRDLPELDDAFARTVGEFEDLASLRARVREDLQREAEGQSEGAVRSQLLDQIVEANPFEIPQSMVDRYIETMLGETKDADPERLERIKEQLRPESEHAVKRLLAIERVADTQQLRATEGELDERIETLATRNQMSPAETYARLQKAGRLQAIEREITEEKVFEFLKEKSTVSDEDE